MPRLAYVVGLLTAALAATATASPLAAQAASGSISGTVNDGESGEPLAGAVVSLIDAERAVVSDSSGHYVLEDVPPGPQHVVVQRIGYSERRLHALVPRDGTMAIHIALRPEPIELDEIEVEVQPLVPVRGLEEGVGTPYPDRGLSMAAVRDHPLLSEPDVFQALGGGEVTLRPESPSGLHVRGGASDQLTYVLDGIPVFSPYHTAGAFSAWNPDALSRIDLLTSAPPPGFPESLSGAVAATTRSAGPVWQSQGSASTTQARVTLDGPLGPFGAGALIGLRTGYPGFPSTEEDPSYLRGENRDWIAKVESPFLAGHARMLIFDNESEIDAAASAQAEDANQDEIDPLRNTFEWHSRSVGGDWRRDFGRLALTVRAWSAVGDAEALWTGGSDSTSESLGAGRRDRGVTASVELQSTHTTTTFGLRAQRSRTSYDLTASTLEALPASFEASVPVTAAYVEHARPLAAELQLETGVLGAVALGDVHWSPRLRLRWSPSESLTLTSAVARLHQFAQSLRNAESFVGNVFPADLYVGAGEVGIPVARTDQAILGAELRPTAGVRVGAQAYVRDLEGLVLVAPRDADPFTAGEFVTGTADARGLALEASANGARYGAVASYGLQDVVYRYGDAQYVPDHGATHALEGGVIVFPSATSSVRLGAVGILGRRTTPVQGAIEWESCNLLDRGCEFAGSPRGLVESLGGAPLPAYFRVDLGLAKHWHIQVAGRDGLISLFGTVTNLFNRRNVLAIAEDPVTGETTEVSMRPRSPLVVGLDWRF